MAFPTGVSAPFLDALVGASSKDLKVAERKIEEVIDEVDDQMKRLEPARFDRFGHIAPASLGGADRSPMLALHHTRAHQVTLDTMHGVIADLTSFRAACRYARQIIEETDQDTAARLEAQRRAADALALGALSDQGEDAHEQAQYDHLFTRPTDTPREA